jgi:hypothetical protein
MMLLDHVRHCHTARPRNISSDIWTVRMHEILETVLCSTAA